MKIITTSLTTIQNLVYMKVYFKTFPKSGHFHKSDKKRRSYDHFKKEVKCCFGCGRRAQHEGRWACTIRPENGWALPEGRWALIIRPGTRWAHPDERWADIPVKLTISCSFKHK